MKSAVMNPDIHSFGLKDKQTQGASAQDQPSRMIKGLLGHVCLSPFSLGANSLPNRKPHKGTIPNDDTKVRFSFADSSAVTDEWGILLHLKSWGKRVI